jgi:hypothetical protein
MRESTSTSSLYLRERGSVDSYDRDAEDNDGDGDDIVNYGVNKSGRNAGVGGEVRLTSRSFLAEANKDRDRDRDSDSRSMVWERGRENRGGPEQQLAAFRAGMRDENNLTIFSSSTASASSSSSSILSRGSRSRPGTRTWTGRRSGSEGNASSSSCSSRDTLGQVTAHAQSQMQICAQHAHTFRCKHTHTHTRTTTLNTHDAPTCKTKTDVCQTQHA